jgi:hypothetical protein
LDMAKLVKPTLFKFCTKAKHTKRAPKSWALQYQIRCTGSPKVISMTVAFLGCSSVIHRPPPTPILGR